MMHGYYKLNRFHSPTLLIINHDIWYKYKMRPQLMIAQTSPKYSNNIDFFKMVL